MSAVGATRGRVEGRVPHLITCRRRQRSVSDLLLAAREPGTTVASGALDSEPPGMSIDAVRHRIGLLTDLFLGAAFADGSFVDRERDYIRSLLKDLLVIDALPAGLEQRIAEFDPARFDL